MLCNSIRTTIPILGARVIRHAPLVAVPAVESVELQRPESRGHVADDDQAVRVPYINAERAVQYVSRGSAARAFPFAMRPLEGVVEADRVRIRWVHHVDDV